MRTKDFWDIKQEQYYKSKFNDPVLFLESKGIKITSKIKKYVKHW